MQTVDYWLVFFCGLITVLSLAFFAEILSDVTKSKNRL